MLGRLSPLSLFDKDGLVAEPLGSISKDGPIGRLDQAQTKRVDFPDTLRTFLALLCADY